MRATLVVIASALLPLASIAGGAEASDAAPPIVQQLLAHAQALDLSDSQVQTLELIRDRRLHTLETLQRRLDATKAQSSAAAQQDAVSLMQEIGRLQVLSGRDALRQLSTAQRRRWVDLQAARKP
jgi:hypothetical protein